MTRARWTQKKRPLGIKANFNTQWSEKQMIKRNGDYTKDLLNRLLVLAAAGANAAEIAFNCRINAEFKDQFLR